MAIILLCVDYFRKGSLFYLSCLRVSFVAGDVVALSLLTWLECPFISVGRRVGIKVASPNFCLPRRNSTNFQPGREHKGGVTKIGSWLFRLAQLLLKWNSEPKPREKFFILVKLRLQVFCCNVTVCVKNTIWLTLLLMMWLSEVLSNKHSAYANWLHLMGVQHF